MNNISYLGDGLYVKIENNQVVLMANDAINPTDTVYLDEQVLDAFVAFLKKENLV